MLGQQTHAPHPTVGRTLVPDTRSVRPTFFRSAACGLIARGARRVSVAERGAEGAGPATAARRLLRRVGRRLLAPPMPALEKGESVFILDIDFGITGEVIRKEVISNRATKVPGTSPIDGEA